MISKNEIKLIKSLNLQKFRNKNNLFKVEGWRTIKEFLKSDYKLINLFLTDDFINTGVILNVPFRKIKQVELNKISSLKSPNQSLAVFEKSNVNYKLNSLKKKLVIGLEDISNPGNLGAIIRTADWFGVSHIFCSLKSVDVYNPKVIQSSMGSLSRVSVHYVDFSSFFLQIKKEKIKTFAADLKGVNLYKKKIKTGIIFFGKESSGLSDTVLSRVSDKISIPSNNHLCDSLNLSVSFGIIISEIMKMK